MRLEIDNWDKSFPMTGTLYVFAANTSEKEIKKWLNNQYSDGLFPEVPQPVSTLKFPDMICKVTSSKYIDRAKAGLGEYDNYTVNFEVKDHDFKDFRLKGFTGETKVHIPAK